ncbi:MAG: hypothetical protein EB060_10225 [Proteobacteria bacterium]|nr:hypothetical protein [Pseudomonadota bacterium]
MVKPESEDDDKLLVEDIEDEDDEEHIYSEMFSGGATVGNLSTNMLVRVAIAVVMVLLTLIVVL